MSSKHGFRERFKNLIAKPREFRDWLRSEDQGLLRLEARWLFRWFTSYPGAVWLIFYVILDLVILNREAIYLQAFGKTYPPGFPAISLYLINKAGFWLYFIKRRIGRFFHAERLQELAVTPCTSEMLWPALCLAPALGVGLLFGIDAILIQLAIVLDGMTRSFQATNLAVELVPTLFALVLELLVSILVFVILLTPTLSFTWCVTTYAVSKCVPDLNDFRLILHAIGLGFVVIFVSSLPGAIIMMVLLATSSAPGAVSNAILASSMIGVFLTQFAIALFMLLRWSRSALTELRSKMSPEYLWRQRESALDRRITER